MKSVLMLIIFLCIHVSKLFAQTNNFAMNTVGIITGIEMNTISGLWGLQYERSLHQQDKLNIGAKAIYVFRYELGNMKFIGGSCCEFNQSAILLASAARFTSPTAKPNRFYLQAGLGAGIKTYAFENLRQQSVFPACPYSFHNWHSRNNIQAW